MIATMDQTVPGGRALSGFYKRIRNERSDMLLKQNVYKVI
jgi:hypothetical protein